MSFFFLVLAAFPALSASTGFLMDRPQNQSVDTSVFESEVESAMGEVLGCGGAVDQEHLTAIERSLEPMWRALPKNSHGRIERQALRYLAHRHFVRKSSLLIRGFEPSRPTNQSHWGAADILSTQVPAYVTSQLESKRALAHGFSLEDAAMMVVTLERLIFDSESTTLEKAYALAKRSTKDKLNHASLAKVLEIYMVNWMMGDDLEGIDILLSNRSLLESTFPHWRGLVEFAEGQIRALEFSRQRPMQGKAALSMQFSFDDAHEVVGGITKSFASFWQSECDSMKTSLVEMDRGATGRVKLSKFYGTALDTEWRFGESEEYLRELGALDESSSWMGKQVIIPNYMQAASNCIVSTPHYLVCCINSCEDLLGEIEEKVGASTASVATILATVGDMSAPIDMEDDATPRLKGSLATQLQKLGEQYNGAVPLHGRLFAQWLHYVFPRECPFPVKIGTMSTATPSEYGDTYLARTEDMQEHATKDAAPGHLNASASNSEWMSQWSHEEELMIDYSGEMRAPWESGSRFSFTFIVFALLAVGVVVGVVGFSGGSRGKNVLNNDDPWMSKAHFV